MISAAQLSSIFEAVCHTGSHHASAKAELQIRFPSIDCDQLQQSYLMMCELHEQGYRIAEAVRSGVYSEAAAMEKMKADWPQLQDTLLKRSIAQGFFENR